jgi:2-dehydro-3-deoxygalactonokinase
MPELPSRGQRRGHRRGETTFSRKRRSPIFVAMIAIDWGTSSFRAYRVGADGATLDRRSSARGILTVESGDFAGVLTSEIGDWLGREPGPIVMSGMIGSRQGWIEVPYVECPAAPEIIARGCRQVTWGDGQRAWIAPGVSCRDAHGVPDVMRGEETQILGALYQLAAEPTVCLPGTHSKLVRIRHGRIESFSTFMTGEVFAVLWRHGILGRLGSTDTVGDDAAFDGGVDRSAQAEGLLHHLFGVRARGLFAEMPPESLASYLSGILIGHEIRASAPRGPVVIIGTAELSRLYGRAFGRLGIEARLIEGEPAPRGLWLIGGIAGDRK